MYFLNFPLRPGSRIFLPFYVCLKQSCSCYRERCFSTLSSSNVLYLVLSWRSCLSVPLHSVHATCTQFLLYHIDHCEAFKYFCWKHIWCCVMIIRTILVSHIYSCGFVVLTWSEKYEMFDIAPSSLPSEEKRSASVLPHFLHLVFVVCVMSDL